MLKFKPQRPLYRSLAHNDITTPDFSGYRRKEGLLTRKNDTKDQRKAFTYLISAACGVGTTYGAKTIVEQFISSMKTAADVLAIAQLAVDLSTIP